MTAQQCDKRGPSAKQKSNSQGLLYTKPIFLLASDYSKTQICLKKHLQRCTMSGFCYHGSGLTEFRNLITILQSIEDCIRGSYKIKKA
jgi:hypothetical protein